MKIFTLSIVLLLLFCASNIDAQIVKDNSKWTFEAKKISGHKYQIIAHLKLEKGWHVYAMKPGGDGTLIPVAIKLDNNTKVKAVGTFTEKGKLISETVPGMDGKVNMYKNSVDYIADAEINGPTTITGICSYQTCNDKMCLPPADKKFSLTVK